MYIQKFVILYWYWAAKFTLCPSVSNIETTSVFRGPMWRLGKSDFVGEKISPTDVVAKQRFNCPKEKCFGKQNKSFDDDCKTALEQVFRSRYIVFFYLINE